MSMTNQDIDSAIAINDNKYTIAKSIDLTSILQRAIDNNRDRLSKDALKNIEHPIAGPDISIDQYIKCLLEVRINQGEFTREEVNKAKDELKSKSPKSITYEFIKERLGRKWRSELAKCCTYMLVFLKVFRKDDYVKPISSWSKSYQAYLPEEFSGNENTRRRNLSKILTELSDLGIIQKVSNDYAFTKDSKCYCYVFNRYLAKKILRWIKNNEPDLFDEENEKKYVEKKFSEIFTTSINNSNSNKNSSSSSKNNKDNENYNNDLDEVIEITDEGIDNINSITSPGPMHITSRTRLPKEVTDEVIYNGLAQNYPYLNKVMNVANRINNTIYNSNGKYIDQGYISYKPKIHRADSGAITKISIRASGPLSNVRAREHLKDTELGIIETREDILLHEWYYKNTREEDKKEELSNQDYSLIHDSLLDYNHSLSHNYSLDYDYSLIKEFDVKASVPRVTYFINHGEWLDNDVDFYDLMFKDENQESGYVGNLNRDSVKQLFMYLYFTGSKKNAVSSLIRALKICKEDQITCRGSFCDFYDRMVSIIGTPLGSEIFLHESNIYILVRDALIHKYHIDCAQIYDAFIIKSEDDNKVNIYSLIKECAMDYKENYLSMTNTIQDFTDHSGCIIKHKLSGSDQVLCVADYHIDNYRNYSPTDSDYDNQSLTGPKENYRLNQSITFAEGLVRYGKSKNINKLFLLGDFLNRANSGPKIVNTGSKVIQILRSQFTIYYILGQHDLASRSNNPDLMDTFLFSYENLSCINPMYYSHNKRFTFVNNKGEDILITFKNFQFESDEIDPDDSKSRLINFGECDVACGHLSLTLGQKSNGIHKLGIFGDIHELVQEKNKSGGTDYSVGTPYQHFPSQLEDGYFGVLDLSDKDKLSYTRVLSDSLLELM